MRCQCVQEFHKPLIMCDMPDPEAKNSEVVVAVQAAGVCHSDLHIWEGEYDLGEGKKMQMSARGLTPPLVLGHEVVGRVVAKGPDVKQDFDADKNYLVFPWIGCGECAVCLAGDENLCSKNPRCLGIQLFGGYSEKMLVPDARYLIDIGDMDPVIAAPFACSGLTTYSALQKIGAHIFQNYPIVIVGAGGLGLMALQILRALGGKGAVVVDVDPVKREAALKEGAIAAIDGRAPDASAQVIAALGGEPARGIVDLVGAPDTIQLGIDASDKGGKIVVVGLFGGSMKLATVMLPLRAISLIGSYVGTLKELQELMELVRAGKVEPLPITRVGFEEADAALQNLKNGKVIGRQVIDFA